MFPPRCFKFMFCFILYFYDVSVRVALKMNGIQNRSQKEENLRKDSLLNFNPVNGDLYFCLLLLILSAKPSNLEFQTIYTHARYTPFPCYR